MHQTESVSQCSMERKAPIWNVSNIIQNEEKSDLTFSQRIRAEIVYAPKNVSEMVFNRTEHGNIRSC